MSFCTTCGQHLAGSIRFCTSCGTPRPPGGEPAHQPTPRRLSGGRAAVAVTAVIALGLGGLLAWHLIGHQAGPAAVAVGSPNLPTGADHEQTPPSALSASPVTSAGPPAASDGTVSIGSAAARQASAGQVAAFLGTYFAAINHRDYQAYISLFDDPARPDRSEQQFLSGYQTTTDSDPVLVALTLTPTGEWAATVTFVSHQSPAASATRSSCTSWDITLYLEPGGNSYLIGLPPPGYQASRAAC